ncbi:hypothetical protein P8H26_12940 [Pseudochrobactrum sp. sp1633]|uniref:hypothetical protein n=1 Tax=Pseudochrobactrum sp. sp1633 TaxID=3036706 RepID=UPI0025A61377|nr:hypothetical protein [Pseudochrobactrum sp. sp1633]MDM8346298.1 hypothetical protein [Pseudochrobactrum sp. sp1633]HWD14085.1 hypothetical protein [Pseudochrobactrum sp.]
MKLRPLTIDQLDCAARLLNEGFHKLSEATWRANLLDIFSHAETLGRSTIGYIAFNKEGDIGICLAIPLVRSIYEQEPVEAINLAAFYIKRDYQWMAAVFLRRIISTSHVDYVDVTASFSMRKINTHLGFSTSAIATLVVPLPTAVWRPSKGAVIRAYDPQLSEGLSEDTTQILSDHIDLGCLVLMIEMNGERHPVILQPKKRGGLRSTRVILVKDRTLIYDALGPLARYLMLRGFFFLELDVLNKPDLWGCSLRKRSAPVQSTLPRLNDAIDHTYTELVFIL